VLCSAEKRSLNSERINVKEFERRTLELTKLADFGKEPSMTGVRRAASVEQYCQHNPFKKIHEAVESLYSGLVAR
jgi:hypothetical protein